MLSMYCRIHPSPGQITADVPQLEGLLWFRTRGEETGLVAEDLVRRQSTTGLHDTKFIDLT